MRFDRHMLSLYYLHTSSGTSEGSSLAPHNLAHNYRFSTISTPYLHDADFRRRGFTSACFICLCSGFSSNCSPVPGCSRRHPVSACCQTCCTSKILTSSIRNHTGYLVLLDPSSLLAKVLPKIKGITIGKDLIFKKHQRKYSSFARHQHSEPSGQLLNRAVGTF